MESINWVIDLDKVENLFANAKSLDEFDDIIEKVKHDNGESDGEFDEDLLDLLVASAKSYHLLGNACIKEGKKGELLIGIFNDFFKEDAKLNFNNLISAIAVANDKINEQYNTLRSSLTSFVTISL